MGGEFPQFAPPTLQPTELRTIWKELRMNDAAPNPAAAEAEGLETVTVEWRTLMPFEVPIYRNDWPYEAVLASEQQQDASLLAALLPALQHQQFVALNPTLRDARDLLNTIARAIGIEHSGESPASSS